MPSLDYALLCDYVRTEGGLAHVVAAGIDTVSRPDVPTGANIGLLMRIGFAKNECGRPHRLEVIFQGEDGERLAVIGGVVDPVWDSSLPVNWSVGALMGINIGVPLPRFGVYSFEILLNDSLVKTLNLRVVKDESGGGHAWGAPPPSLEEG